MQVSQIIIKRERGKLVVKAMGQTPKGKQFIKKQKELTVDSPSDPKFKDEMRTAVGELLGSVE